MYDVIFHCCFTHAFFNLIIIILLVHCIQNLSCSLMFWSAFHLLLRVNNKPIWSSYYMFGFWSIHSINSKYFYCLTTTNLSRKHEFVFHLFTVDFKLYEKHFRGWFSVAFVLSLVHLIFQHMQLIKYEFQTHIPLLFY